MKRIAWYTLGFLIICSHAWAWHDETHLAIAKVAGYKKWYNAAGADIAKIKAGGAEKRNHYANNPPGTVVTARMVLDQAALYNKSFDLKPTSRLVTVLLCSKRY